MVCVCVNQAYSRLSTTHGHITDCKLESVVYAGVCVVIWYTGGTKSVIVMKANQTDLHDVLHCVCPFKVRVG